MEPEFHPDSSRSQFEQVIADCKKRLHRWGHVTLVEREPDTDPQFEVARIFAAGESDPRVVVYVGDGGNVIKLENWMTVIRDERLC